MIRQKVLKLLFSVAPKRTQGRVEVVLPPDYEGALHTRWGIWSGEGISGCAWLLHKRGLHGIPPGQNTKKRKARLTHVQQPCTSAHTREALVPQSLEWEMGAPPPSPLLSMTARLPNAPGCYVRISVLNLRPPCPLPSAPAHILTAPG